MSAFERVVAGSRGLNVFDDAFNEMYLYSMRRMGPIGASFGHSMVAPDFNGSDYFTPGSDNNPPNRNSQHNSDLQWALILSEQRVSVPYQNIRSYPSQDTSYGLAKLTAFLDSVAPISFIKLDWGTNDVLHNIPYSTMTDNYWGMIQLCLDRNIRVIAMPQPGRTIAGTPLTAAQYANLDRLNYWIDQLPGRTRGMVGVPKYLRKLNDPALANPIARAGMMMDGTHPNGSGAFIRGEGIATLLMHWFPRQGGLLANSNSRFDATTNPYGNMIRNPMMQTGTGQTAGTLTNVTGTAPDEWTLTRQGNAGITVAAALVTDSDGGPSCQFTLGGTYTLSGTPAVDNANGARIFGNFVTGAGLAGDMVECLIGFEIDAGHSGIMAPNVQYRWNGSTGYNQTLAIGSEGGIPAGQAIKGIIRTFPHLIGATGETLGQLLAFISTQSSPIGVVNPVAVCRFSAPVARKIN